MIPGLAHTMVVIILQDRSVLNQHIVHLKLTERYTSIMSQ